MASRNNIVTAQVEIRGTRPLLQHAFGPDAIPLQKQEKTGVAGNDPEEWRRTCLVTGDGQLFIRGTYIFSMLRDAAKHTKKGRGSIQTLVAATLLVEQDRILLDRWMPESGPVADATQPVYVDVSGVRNPTTKGRNVRYRLACSVGWKCGFTILFDKTVVSTSQIQSVLNDAGILTGLADGRSVGFGRFAVEKFSVVNGDTPA